jgi:hypothetical protein
VLLEKLVHYAYQAGEYDAQMLTMPWFMWCWTQAHLLAVQVIIEGFKSYKDQTIAEPFSNKINTVGTSLGAAHVVCSHA